MARNPDSTRRKSAAESDTGAPKKDARASTEEEGAVSGKTATTAPSSAKDDEAAAVLQWPMPFPVPDSETFAPINRKLLQHASSLGGDFMSFGQKRYGRDLETITQLCRCSSPQEVSEVQQQWLDRATEDYRHDGIELFRSVGALFSEAMQTPFQFYSAMTRNQRYDQGKSR